MNDDQDFTIEAGDRQPDTEPEPASPPLVVIEYRNRGIPSVLVPPVLIVLVALVILSYQRQTPPHRPFRGRDQARAHSGRTILVEPPAEGSAFDPLVIRAEAAPAATPAAASPIIEPAEIVADAAPIERGVSPFDLDALDGLRPVVPASSPEDIDVTVPSAPGPAPVAIPATPPTGPAPDPEPKPVAPAPVAQPAGVDRPAIGFRPPPEHEPPPAQPKVTEEQVEAEIRREAAQREAARQNLEEWKPQLFALERDEALHKAASDRIRFHNDLRRALHDRGNQAGPIIEKLCESYGRTTTPEIQETVTRLLKRSAGGFNLQAKVELMRRYGLPEPMILDFVANKIDRRSKYARGGPRNESEVWVLAVRRLLAMPPPGASSGLPSRGLSGPIQAPPSPFARAVAPPVLNPSH